MVRKKTEGNEEQRRATARRARRDGTEPSARKETTGASKQPGHAPRHAAHDSKVAGIHEGKQQQARRARLEERAAAEPDARSGRDTSGTRGGSGTRDVSGTRGTSGATEYSQEHEKVFTALVMAQEEHGGEGVRLDEIARRSDVPRQRVRALLHDLATAQRLVTEVEDRDTPDLGPRYEEKPLL